MTPPNKPKTPGEAARAAFNRQCDETSVDARKNRDAIAAAAISAAREGEDWRSAAERAALAIDPYPELDVAHDALTRALEGGAQRADPTEAERAHCERIARDFAEFGTANFHTLYPHEVAELLLRERAAARAEGEQKQYHVLLAGLDIKDAELTDLRKRYEALSEDLAATRATVSGVIEEWRSWGPDDEASEFANEIEAAVAAKPGWGVE